MPIYLLTTIAGILLTAYIWSRMTESGPRRDSRLVFIYFWALFGALLGAKIAFLIAEGWQYRHDWLALLSGRSITGGLLGGYAAVEWAKRRYKYTSVTGDLFAIIVPLAIALGRLGCCFQGGCPGISCDAHWWTLHGLDGIDRWPSAPAELTFNLAFLLWAALAARLGWQPGNRFHIYLVGYGGFRFAHEFMRERVAWVGPFGGYHALALTLFAFGLIRWTQRRAAVRSVRSSTGLRALPPDSSHAL